jgi:hypothetical protein
MSPLQRGQGSFFVAATSVRAMAAPQWEQNFAPAKTIPKQEGHATTARREPQCSHWVASEETGAPHVGQFIVSGAGIARRYTLKGGRCQCPTHYIIGPNL